MLRVVLLILTIQIFSLLCANADEGRLSSSFVSEEWKIDGLPVGSVVSAELSIGGKYLLLVGRNEERATLFAQILELRGGSAVEVGIALLDSMTEFCCARFVGANEVMLVGEYQDGEQTTIEANLYDLATAQAIRIANQFSEFPGQLEVSVDGEIVIIDGAIWNLRGGYSSGILQGSFGGALRPKIRGPVIFVETYSQLTGSRITVVSRNSGHVLWDRDIFYRTMFVSPCGRVLGLRGALGYPDRLLIIDAWTGREMGSVAWPFGNFDVELDRAEDFAFWNAASISVARKESVLSLIDSDGSVAFQEAIFDRQSSVFMPKRFGDPIIEIRGERIVFWRLLEEDVHDLLRNDLGVFPGTDESTLNSNVSRLDLNSPDPSTVDTSSDGHDRLISVGDGFAVCSAGDDSVRLISGSTPIGFVPGSKLIIGIDGAVVTLLDGQSGRELFRRTISTEDGAAIQHVDFGSGKGQVFLLGSNGILTVLECAFDLGVSESPSFFVRREEHLNELVFNGGRPSRIDLFACSGDGKTFALWVRDQNTIFVVRGGVIIAKLLTENELGDLTISEDGGRVNYVDGDGVSRAWTQGT